MSRYTFLSDIDSRQHIGIYVMNKMSTCVESYGVNDISTKNIGMSSHTSISICLEDQLVE